LVSFAISFSHSEKYGKTQQAKKGGFILNESVDHLIRDLQTFYLETLNGCSTKEL